MKKHALYVFNVFYLLQLYDLCGTSSSIFKLLNLVTNVKNEDQKTIKKSLKFQMSINISKEPLCFLNYNMSNNIEY